MSTLELLERRQALRERRRDRARRRRRLADDRPRRGRRALRPERLRQDDAAAARRRPARARRRRRALRPTGKSPEGPHTHVLPKLLRSGRTHPATEPIPEWLDTLRAYLSAASGPRRHGRTPAIRCGASPFVSADDGELRRSQNTAIKRRVAEAVLAEEPPSAIAGDRHGRASIRIALRQMKAGDTGRRHWAPGLPISTRAAPEDGDDEANLHHEG